jgi:molybdenum cofactor synthesis domain-containing protein
MTPLDEEIGDVRADEPGPTREKYAHSRTLGDRRDDGVHGVGGAPTTLGAMENQPLHGGAEELLGRALVVVVDDRVSRGESSDSIGPLVTELLGEAGLVVDGTIVVPGESVAIRNALNTAVIGGVDLVVTVGGTGVSPRAVTSDATAGVLDRPIPGIAEAIRASGLAAGAVDAGLSRGLVGVSGSTLVVNLASSRAAVRDGMATLTPLISHVIAELSGMEEH